MEASKLWSCKALASQLGTTPGALRAELSRRKILPDKMALDEYGHWCAHYGPKKVKAIEKLYTLPRTVGRPKGYSPAKKGRFK